jgi:hypothetical protein
MSDRDSSTARRRVDGHVRDSVMAEIDKCVDQLVELVLTD